MIRLQIIVGSELVVKGLWRLGSGIPDAITEGLTKSAKAIHRSAFEYLSGPGAKKSNVPGGGYPVPIRTGHLRRLLDFVPPGKSKSKTGKTFTAGPMEAVVFNSAEYASAIHDGAGSSKKFGRRPYLDDARLEVNVLGYIQEELDKLQRASL
jgi:hypothetical protein